jgi:hypothetical protein
VDRLVRRRPHENNKTCTLSARSACPAAGRNSKVGALSTEILNAHQINIGWLMDPNTSLNSYIPFSILMFESPWPWTFTSAGIEFQNYSSYRLMRQNKWETNVLCDFNNENFALESCRSSGASKSKVFHISIYKKDKKIQP